MLYAFWTRFKDSDDNTDNKYYDDGWDAYEDDETHEVNIDDIPRELCFGSFGVVSTRFTAFSLSCIAYCTPLYYSALHNYALYRAPNMFCCFQQNMVLIKSGS